MKLPSARSLRLLLCLLPAPPVLLAAPDGQQAAVEVEAARGVASAYARLRDAVYDYEPLELVQLLHAEATALLEGAPVGERELSLWRSRIEYLLGRAYQAREDKKRAAPCYERGLELARKVLQGGELSEAYRMMSENLGQLCVVKDLGFLILNGPNVPRYAEKALELDPCNPAAQILIASGKIYPPPIAGGDPKAGIALMKRALEMGASEKDDLFNIYSGIGLAYGKLGSKGEAAAWLEKALSIYPNNRFAREERTKLRQ
jgi:tetratricopeptide (TPR) repeat protein